MEHQMNLGVWFSEFDDLFKFLFKLIDVNLLFKWWTIKMTSSSGVHSSSLYFFCAFVLYSVLFLNLLKIKFKFKPYSYSPLNFVSQYIYIYIPYEYVSRRSDWTPAAFMHACCRVCLYSSFRIQQKMLICWF